MCGIAGYIHKSTCTELCSDLGKKVQELQACRGPDNNSTTTYVAENWTTHFYHQHLRVADLNTLANQPMRSKADPALSIILNGEIYNHSRLRSQLKHQPLTHSDTEVLVELIAQKSAAETLKLIRGMFAWATLNEREAEFQLVRDRFGEKPLHLVKNSDSIFFSSQYDSAAYFIKKTSDFQIDRGALSSYFSLGYVPYRQSLLTGIEKITPGGMFTLNLKSPDWTSTQQTRWIPPFEATADKQFTAEELEGTLRKSVREQLEADVPVGLFLSGGVDSSLISALAQQEHSQSMHSFSIGFEQDDFDESTYALNVANALGTTHHARKMTSEDARSILNKVTHAFTEPLGDPSVFPTTFVSQFAREHVTVCLTGDGADELFFGYGRYARYQFLEQSIQRSSSLKTLASTAVMIPGLLSLLGPRGARLRRLIESNAPLETYLPLVGFQHINQAISRIPLTLEGGISREYLNLNPKDSSLNWMREFDVDSYLADDILVKVDRAAMSSSLETRAPFLDSRVVEIAGSLDKNGLVNPSQKNILKLIIGKYAPNVDFDRKKQGFGAPLGDWFRSSLKDWGASIIEETDWESLGLIDTEVNDIWDGLQKSSKKDATHEWLILSLGSSVGRLTCL
jgi:asparagine synthase (glutamine-hydrolysing)